MSRKIYTKVVIDMATSTVIEEESYEHDGPVAECKGGGGGSTVDSVDEEYNARLATLYEEQQDWAREYFDFWKAEQKPLESAMIASDMREVELRSPVQDAFYQKSLEGVDTEARAASAGADVQHSFDNMQQQLARQSSRLGIDAGSGKMASAMSSMGNELTKSKAGAMNTARTAADDDNYKRLAAAMGMSSGG
jgi:hypothetical protein